MEVEVYEKKLTIRQLDNQEPLERILATQENNKGTTSSVAAVRC